MKIRAILFFLLASTAFAADPIRPDPKLTPGVALSVQNEATVCTIKWGKDARHVTPAMKRQVFANYKIPYARHGEFEVDHLISRELGGADDVKNLWPQKWAGTWNAHMKDQLENRLHKMVCAGQLSLAQAQREIRADWIAAYRQDIVPAPKTKLIYNPSTDHGAP
jgi:hypothetical protein